MIDEGWTDEVNTVVRAYRRGALPVAPRPRDEIEGFLGDFEPAARGVEQVQLRRPGGPVPAVSGGIYDGVGRKR